MGPDPGRSIARMKAGCQESPTGPLAGPAVLGYAM